MIRFLDILKLSIVNKIVLSFLLIIVLLVFNGGFTYSTLNDSIDVVHTISDDIDPALNSLGELETLIKDSKSYSINWVYVKKYADDREKLREIHEEKYPVLKAALLELNTRKENKNLLEITAAFDSLLAIQSLIMDNLATDDDYEDILRVLESEDLIETAVIPMSTGLLLKLQTEIDIKVTESNGYKRVMLGSFETLQLTIIILGVVVVLMAILISMFLSKSIANPILGLNRIIQKMSIGELPEVNVKTSGDELEEMKNSTKKLVLALRTTSEFAAKVGQGDIHAEFTPLSEGDVLGHSLMTMRDNLKSVIDDTNDVVAQAGSQGDLRARMDLDGKQGAWKELGASINNLLTSIANPVIIVNEIVNAMAKGDLTKRFNEDVKGEVKMLANNLNTALDNLNGLLEQITMNATTVDESSSEMLVSCEEMNVNTDEIASAISEVSSGAQTQVAKVDESSGLVEQILKASNDMSDHAKTINSAAKTGVMNCDKGTEMVDNVVKSMMDISEYSGKTNESIAVLTERSKEINRMLGIITDIAAQTNLLALNAAIEAAQAGDAGRGFAVVAEEIRKLAEDSKRSANEIERLVLDVQDDTERAASVIQTMNSSVQTGEKASKEASEVFKRIADSSEKTLNFSEEIVNAAGVQNDGINNVVTLTESIVVIAEQTATGTEEMATSATELSSGMHSYTEKSGWLTKVANELQEAVGKFDLVGGK